MQRSIRKSLLVGMPIAVVALALFVLSLGNGVMKAHAASPDPAVNFNISSTGCSSDGTAKCNVGLGGSFSVALNISALPSTGGYEGFDSQLNWNSAILTGPTAGGMVHQGPGGGNWPDCAFPASAFGAGQSNAGCAFGVGASDSTYLGQLLTEDFTCSSTPSTSTITLSTANTDVITASAVLSENQTGDESITVNCVPAPTATPVPPTPTPPPNPKMQKTCVDTTSGTGTGGALCNVFLQRQGAKIPPTTCAAGNDSATLNEGINIPITSQDPKGVTQFQNLAAFEFDVRFDAKLVCVSIAPGPLFSGANAICSALDNGDKGTIQYGCVTTGKNNHINGPGTLAVITVKPQPELYSQLRPNQDNGIPVQILNQGCQLADEQGHPIPVFSCEDADITFRFLEGDVDGPDCDVDVLDAQQVAFRWGASKGALLFNSFFDLVPSGQVKGDGHINITDLQFVFGRLGSTCTHPWPAQPPVNPKA